MNNLKRYMTGLMALPLWVLLALNVQAQQANWQNLDLQTDGVFGISTEKAYAELLKVKKPAKVKPVLVAVLDSGVDPEHEDLKAVIWVNKKERPGNGKDDDRNGYTDDVNGWNFLGAIHHDTYELTRLVKRGQLRFGNKVKTDIPDTEKPDYEAYQRLLADYQKEVALAKESMAAYAASNEPRADEAVKYFKGKLDYYLNLDYDPAAERNVAAGPTAKNRFYGTNEVKGPDAKHGTHVAGIIAAVRDNELGIKGVADQALIMSIRSTPDGDERDNDVANAIRYAADNGAKIINMSFGKAYSADKQLVDEAVKYAVKKGVLLVHAAGNAGKNLDLEANFPNPDHLGDQVVASWITVGASGWKDDETLKAKFSNYGKTKVDVFAPGVAINSTIPDAKYASFEGTSMAAPVVSGLAALIWTYYPKLKAAQVKEIMMKSVVKREALKDLCVSGGVVNVYEALKLAAMED